VTSIAAPAHQYVGGVATVTGTGPFTDLVPAETRQAWSQRGWYADEDLYALFARQAARTPDRDAVIDEHGTTSYAELDRTVRRLAVGLGALGVRPGDVVGVQLPNRALSCAIDLAVASLGAIAMPYPVGRGDRDIRNLLGRAGAVLAIAATAHGDYPCARRTLELADQLPALRSVIAVGRHPAPGCIPLSLVLAADPGEFRHQWPDPNGAARILVSSGSEAEPKMVAYSHNALAGGRGRILADLREPGAEFRALFLVPLGTAFGSYGTAATLAANGGTMLLLPRFDPSSALRLIDRGRPSHVLGVPTMLRKILDHPAVAETDLGSVRAAVLGGSTLDAIMAARIRATMQCAVINLYGSADGVSSHTRLDDPPERDTSSGRPDHSICQLRLVDDELGPVPAGQVGEIVGLGPMTPMGYVDAPELDARYRLPGGWVCSGDLGRLDADGYLHIVGRRKDVIIRGGANVSPAEVEALLLTHPAIIDAACVAVPDPTYGERMCCCIAGTEPLTLAKLCRYLSERGLEPRKLPEHHLLLPALPVNAAGKIDRRTLQQLAAQQFAARAAVAVEAEPPVSRARCGDGPGGSAGRHPG